MTNIINNHYYIDYINYFYGFMFVLLHLTFTSINNLLFLIMTNIVVIAIFL